MDQQHGETPAHPPVSTEREKALQAQLATLQAAHRKLMETHGNLCVEYGTRLQQLARAGVLLT